MNYYDILGVNKTASQEEIKEAYKKLIKKYHPDLYQGDKSFAEKKTKDINVAYDILSNPETRNNYDNEITPKYENISYDYTPPKYNNPNSYHNYYKNVNYNYSNFDDYQKRYTNYHRSKTPSSNYSSNQNIHDNFSENIINSINKMSYPNKIKGLFIIVILYFIIFIMAFIQLTQFSTGKKSGTILNNKENNINKNTIINNTTIPKSPSKKPTFEEFNINDYYSDKELLDIYQENYTDLFSTYSEFKKTFSYYVYLYYNF